MGRAVSADYAPLEVSWVPADPSNYHAAARLPGAEYDLVVIHCTDGHARAESVAEMWQKANHGGKHSSAHYVIGQDGAVIQCVALADVAWHAHDAANVHSVGIEHCARTPGELGHDDPGLPPSEALYESSAKLVAWLLWRASLETVDLRSIIRGHAEVDPKTTHTRCPLGCGWEWEKYLLMVRAELDALEGPA